MKKLDKKISLKEKLENIKRGINKVRDKKSVKEGSIIYDVEGDKLGVCISKNKYVTINENDTNKKVTEKNIEPSVEYYVGCINKESFGSKNLKKIVENSVGESNIFGLKYKNTSEFVSKKVNEDNNKNLVAKDFQKLKEKLKNDYNINKWFSTFTSLSVKELEEKIEEKEKEKEELSKKYEEDSQRNNEEISKMEDLINQKNEIENKLKEDEISDEDKDKRNKELQELLDKVNFDEILKELEKLKEENENLKLEFLNKEKDLNKEIKDLENNLERAKEAEIAESAKTKEILERDMNNLKQELKKASIDEIEEIEGEIEDLIGVSKEINDEKIEDKENIIKFINSVGGISDSFKKGKNIMRGWDLSLSEFKKLGNNFFNLLSTYENNKKLKRLIDRIGRNIDKEDKITEMISQKINKINYYGKEEVFGIEFGNDLMRVLPSELGYLSDEKTEDIFYLKFLENKLLCYSLIGGENADNEEEEEKKVKFEEKGAIIALLDTSGSMHGYPIENAKAVLLQAFRIAKLDKRDMKVMLFGSYGQVKEYTVDKNYSINNFLDFISGGYNGGTDFETPISKAIDVVTKDKKYKFADIFMLTDGACGISSNLEQKIKVAKKNMDLKIYTVIFGGYGYGSIDRFSDEVMNFD